MNFSKIVKAGLGSPHQELFVCGLGFVVAHSVRWIFSVCMYWWSNPAAGLELIEAAHSAKSEWVFFGRSHGAYHTACSLTMSQMLSSHCIFIFLTCVLLTYIALLAFHCLSRAQAKIFTHCCGFSPRWIDTPVTRNPHGDNINLRASSKMKKHSTYQPNIPGGGKAP